MERRTVGLSVKNLGRKMIIAAVSTLLISTVAIPEAEAAMSDREQGNIAGYWSPVLYQDVGNGPHTDIPTAVDFDGDWNGTNNWENIDNYASGKNPLYPWLYWSLAETETHYFIGYDVFYARNDPEGVAGPIGDGLGDHENDMEGMLLVVRKPGVTRKDGSVVDRSQFPNGELELLLAERHGKLGMYSPSNQAIRYSPGQDSVYYDYGFTTIKDQRGEHVRVYSAQNNAPITEPQGDVGHALRAYDGKGAKGNSGYIFEWGGAGVQPQNLNSKDQNYWKNYLSDFDESKRMNYGLKALQHTLWPLRNDFSIQLWSSYGTFKGDNGKEDAASAPWGWSFKGYRDLGRGTILTDPASFVDALFKDKGPYSKNYLTNPYR
ncbi:hypothetical protein ASL14_12830 [Paenibacillus sp. IHB B 3084]|uniref:hypothetical protein n=1 Tax=Paenibacillus sp. IHB B 3084 TaxID=867076 RepID=UPI00072026AA|nr:hypothetical protein [Paenibacillus sp. IHB B 3084]ALP36920.1 hypothetical protein ASL14_12830 [Paenibacillus sp. IHB B 3084]